MIALTLLPLYGYRVLGGDMDGWCSVLTDRGTAGIVYRPGSLLTEADMRSTTPVIYVGGCAYVVRARVHYTAHRLDLIGYDSVVRCVNLYPSELSQAGAELQDGRKGPACKALESHVAKYMADLYDRGKPSVDLYLSEVDL